MGTNLRSQITMTPDEIAAFLTECRTLYVATINRDGSPHLVPMYFVVIDGAIMFWTYRTSQKVKNLRRDPRLTCVVEAGDRTEELRAVQIRGVAEIEPARQDVLAVGSALHERYVGPLDESSLVAVTRNAAKRVAILVHASSMTSWDHRKLASYRS